MYKTIIESEIKLLNTKQIKEVLNNFFKSVTIDKELITLWQNILPCFIYMVCIDNVKIKDIKLKKFYTDEFKHYYKDCSDFRKEFEYIIDAINKHQ